MLKTQIQKKKNQKSANKIDDPQFKLTQLIQIRAFVFAPCIRFANMSIYFVHNCTATPRPRHGDMMFAIQHRIVFVFVLNAS